MAYQTIIGTLGYILSEDQKEVLLVHRNKRVSDDHFGKYNGLGGKMEPGESVFTCMQREIKEEAGIDCLEMRLRGTMHWSGFGANKENWMGFIFLIFKFSGTPYKENDEGALSWTPIETIHSLPMWEGDSLFLPHVFTEKKHLFHGQFAYDGNILLSHQFSFENTH